MISFSVISMPNALGSVTLIAMLIPCLQENVPIGADDLSNCIQLPRRKTMVLAQRYSFEPKLAHKIVALNVIDRGRPLVF